MAWDLGIPLKKRKLNTHGIRSPKSDQWEHITGWADDSIEEEGEDEERIGTDGDILGDVTDSSKRARKMSSTEETAFGQQWEANMTAFKPDQVRRAVSPTNSTHPHTSTASSDSALKRTPTGLTTYCCATLTRLSFLHLLMVPSKLGILTRPSLQTQASLDLTPTTFDVCLSGMA